MLHAIAIALAEFNAHLIAHLGMKINLSTIVAFSKMAHKVLEAIGGNSDD